MDGINFGRGNVSERFGGMRNERGRDGKKSETPVSEEKIDVLNQEEKMRMSVVCLQDIHSQTVSLNTGWKTDIIWMLR